jgi:hypothetical protein
LYRISAIFIRASVVTRKRKRTFSSLVPRSLV